MVPSNCFKRYVNEKIVRSLYVFELINMPLITIYNTMLLILVNSSMKITKFEYKKSMTLRIIITSILFIRKIAESVECTD